MLLSTFPTIPIEADPVLYRRTQFWLRLLTQLLSPSAKLLCNCQCTVHPSAERHCQCDDRIVHCCISLDSTSCIKLWNTPKTIMSSEFLTLDQRPPRDGNTLAVGHTTQWRGGACLGDVHQYYSYRVGVGVESVRKDTFRLFGPILSRRAESDSVDSTS